jgi:hypothetical protein
MDLKELDIEKTQFDANGVTYYVKPSLSIERFKWYEKYQINFGYGRSFEEIHNALKKSIDLANKGKGVEAWNIIYNLYESAGKELDKRAHQAFYLCALFICTENEDLTKWDETIAEEKIKNWNAEGISSNSFFRVAANLVIGFIDALEPTSQDISEVQNTLNSLAELGKNISE